jgi:hypothetical protein
VSTRASIAAVAALAGLLTLLTSVTSAVDLAYESAPLHVAVETAAALISLLAGQLILGRYARSTQLADLLLAAALILLAFGNLALSRFRPSSSRRAERSPPGARCSSGR